MRAMGVRCIQPASPTIPKKEEDVVGILSVQQLRTEKTVWKCCQSIKGVQQPIYKDNSNNNCKEQLYYKQISFIFMLLYIFFLSKIVFILHSSMKNEKFSRKAIFVFNSI